MHSIAYGNRLALGIDANAPQAMFSDLNSGSGPPREFDCSSIEDRNRLCISLVKPLHRRESSDQVSQKCLCMGKERTHNGLMQKIPRFSVISLNREAGCSYTLSFPGSTRMAGVIEDNDNSTGAYVVGLSVVLFYMLRTYFQARAVWKQPGCIFLPVSVPQVRFSACPDITREVRCVEGKA